MQLLIQQGFKHDKERDVVNGGWTGEQIIAKSVDAERDEDCGVELSKFNLNYVFEPKDPRDKKLSLHYKEIDPTKLPTKVDLSENFGTMFDQGDLGSCVSNSVAYCIRWVRQKEGLSVYDPSRLYIYYYGRVIEEVPPTEDSGLYIRDGYKSVANYSVCSERNWPYIISKFHIEPNEYARNAARQHKTFSYLSVAHNLNEIKWCLAQGYPISFGFTVFSSFMSAEVARTGIVPYPDVTREVQYGGHAVTITGYDDETRRFKIANSWGDKWGDGGFCYMDYSFVTNWRYCDDFWTARSFK